jgi:hypothetical protein
LWPLARLGRTVVGVSPTSKNDRGSTPTNRSLPPPAPPLLEFS